MKTIPKIIHYCWFGGAKMPDEYKRYIETWKKYCPDYEIKEWNEANFDLSKNTFIKEAYEAKKWAFVTDYVRLYVLYNYGGVYMDADVEVLKPLDRFLKDEAFSGFETKTDIPTGIMASVKGFGLYKEFLDYYEGRHFKLDNGEYDTTTNVIIMTNICKKYGLKQNNTKQTIKGWTLYPKDYFCPKSHEKGTVRLTKNSATIHHFSGSWLAGAARRRRMLKYKFCNKFGEKMGPVLYHAIFWPYIVITTIKEEGGKQLANNIKKKFVKEKPKAKGGSK